MESFEKYRLNSFSEIDVLVSKTGADKFYPYQERVFETLRKIRPGDRYDISANIRAENREIFIKCACVYMIRERGNCNIVFSDGYAEITGILPFNGTRREMEAYREQTAKMTKHEKGK